jgi:hypothetical protein
MLCVRKYAARLLDQNLIKFFCSGRLAVLGLHGSWLQPLSSHNVLQDGGFFIQAVSCNRGNDIQQSTSQCFFSIR